MLAAEVPWYHSVLRRSRVLCGVCGRHPGSCVCSAVPVPPPTSRAEVRIAAGGAAAKPFHSTVVLHVCVCVCGCGCGCVAMRGCVWLHLLPGRMKQRFGFLYDGYLDRPGQRLWFWEQVVNMRYGATQCSWICCVAPALCCVTRDAACWCLPVAGSSP